MPVQRLFAADVPLPAGRPNVLPAPGPSALTATGTRFLAVGRHEIDGWDDRTQTGWSELLRAVAADAPLEFTGREIGF